MSSSTRNRAADSLALLPPSNRETPAPPATPRERVARLHAARGTPDPRAGCDTGRALSKDLGQQIADRDAISLRARLLDHHGGRHLASEPHLKIQVRPVPVRAGDGSPFFNALPRRGACRVQTERDSCELAQGDQVLLLDGEGFRIDRSNGTEAGVASSSWRDLARPRRSRTSHGAKG